MVSSSQVLGKYLPKIVSNYLKSSTNHSEKSAILKTTAYVSMIKDEEQERGL